MPLAMTALVKRLSGLTRQRWQLPLAVAAGSAAPKVISGAAAQKQDERFYDFFHKHVVQSSTVLKFDYIDIADIGIIPNFSKTACGGTLSRFKTVSA